MGQSVLCIYRHVLFLAVLLLVGVEAGPVLHMFVPGCVFPQRGHALDEAGAHVAVKPFLDA